MWYYIRHAYNYLLTAFQLIGLVLIGLGATIVVALIIGVMTCAVQQLLGYDLLLADDMVKWLAVSGFVSWGLGAFLTILGLHATHPDYIRRTR